ncbi:hypothetical protein M436DRAFT_65327 [Aureobasidium namibiae CBS 147.97]|uniref:Uncharacterized protein n=1 Tax=Aureobasidium namibiae CBS 147.97 TaxID=1043004 RepID=A0A074WQ71_9PEZI
MSFGWSISDVILLAQYSWKVYESFTDGNYNATNEYECFKREYRQVITCLERLVVVSPDLASLAGFDETFGDTIKFIDKHRILTAKTTRPLITALPQTSSRIKDFLDRVGRGYQTATWPIYREEAEKLHRQLDRVVAIATLHATTTTLQNTHGIERQSEEIMRAVKSLSDKVNFVLRRITPTSITSTTDLDINYLTTLSHTSINQPSALHQITAHLDRNESPDDMLQLLHQFSQKMEYLIMRDSGGVRPVVRHQTSNIQGAVTAERIVPVLQLLDTARSVVDTALGLTPTQTHPRNQERSPSVSLGVRAEDWDVFGQWLKWHMLHHEPTRSKRPVQPPRVVSTESAPPTSPGALQAPRQQLTGRPRGDISPMGSPLPEPVFTPGTDAFSDAFSTPEILRSPSGVVEKLRSRTRDQKTIYHLPHGGATRANTFVPWVDNSRVHKSSLTEARLQFKGLHQIIVKDERAHRSTIYNTRPMYCFDELEDLQYVQEQLLGKTMVATLDVVRISTRAGQDHCASETLRVLEDAERQRSLLYYAHKMSAKSATQSPGFIEWSYQESRQKEGQIDIQSARQLQRRSTIGSIDSVLSNDSTSSKNLQTSIMDRIKAIDCEFYDQEDREAFEELCKPSSAPVFRMPFRPRDVGIGSPLAELDIGLPLAELEG